MTFSVERVPAAETYAVRQQVLRPHQRPDELRLNGDDDPLTATFAARDPTGAVLGAARVAPQACPWRPERPDAWRLRGMATVESVRGQGVGARVLAAAVAHVADSGGGLLWCHARTGALSFYLRAGFTGHGSVWEEPEIGPHLRMWREVAALRRPDFPSR